MEPAVNELTRVLLPAVARLLVAALLSWPLGHLVNPILTMCGLKNPVVIWLLGPLVVFIIILIVFKV